MAMIDLDLPLEETPLGRALVWLVAGLAFLAVLAAAVATLADGRLRELQREPTVITLALPPAEGQAEAEQRTGLVMAMLRRQPGLAYATPLSADELSDLVAPWMAQPQLGETALMPQLIDLAFNPGSAPDLGQLRRDLEALVPGATLGETGELKETQADLQSFARLAAASVVAALLLLTVVAVIVVTRINLRLHGASIDVLRLMGARDAYVARQLELHALDKVLKGALWGFLGAAGLLAILVHGSRLLALGGLVRIDLRPLDWALLAVVPVVTILLAVLAARLTASIGLMRRRY